MAKVTPVYGSRDKNFIIHRCAETSAAEDKEYVNSLLQVLELEEEVGSIAKITRLGAKQDDRKRPIRVAMNNAGAKRKVIMSAYKLKDQEEKFKQISITYDLNLEEREMTKKMVTEAKRKTEETGVKHVVRGPPWSLQIRQIANKTD